MNSPSRLKKVKIKDIIEEDKNEEELEEENSAYYARHTVIIDKPIKLDLNKIMIPYDFDNNRYVIKENDIKFYENKEYVLKTLKIFEDNPLFNIEKKLNPQGCCKKFIFVYLPTLIVFLIYFYITFLLAVYTFFNIGVLYYCFVVGISLNNFIKILKYSFYDKFKVGQINKILNAENKSDECIQNKIKWQLGDSSYFLEVIKYEWEYIEIWIVC